MSRSASFPWPIRGSAWWIRSSAVDGADVRVVERRGRPRFSLEAFQHLRRDGDTGQEDFDRGVTPKLRVARAIHFAHAAAAEEREDFVWADPGAWSHCHACGCERIIRVASGGFVVRLPTRSPVQHNP